MHCPWHLCTFTSFSLGLVEVVFKYSRELYIFCSDKVLMSIQLIKNYRRLVTLSATCLRVHCNQTSHLCTEAREFASVTRFLKLKSVTLRKMVECKWVTTSEGGCPPGAVEGGYDNESKLMVIRAYHDNDLLPGKFHVDYNTAYVSWAGKEYEKDSYEVLTAPFGTLGWQSCSGGNIPTNALAGGKSAEGETLYIGRVQHLGTLTIGKVHPSHGSCYIPYDGLELSFESYEILVEINNSSGS